MQIDRIIFPVQTLGPGNRMVIWTIGCPHHCNDCSNPELWDSDVTRDIPVSDVLNIIKEQEGIDGITITGGEPFIQKEDLLKLVSGIKEIGINDVLVYTGFLYTDLKRENINKQILDYIDVLIDGRYFEELNDNIGIRGSKNQKIYVLNQKLKDLYVNATYQKRQRQNFVNSGKVISVGIPLK